jgi:hypothetical protein
MRTRWLRLTVLVLMLCAVSYLFYRYRRDVWAPWLGVYERPPVMVELLQDIGPNAREHLGASFRRAGVAYPPRAAALLYFKNEQVIELWAAHESGWTHVEDIAVRSANDQPGPKLTTDDGRIPEGRYRIARLTTRSDFHLSLYLKFPNAADRENALADGSEAPAGSIHIHGTDVADRRGGIAVGDDAVERLFVLMNDADRNAVRMIIAPNDIRGGVPALRGRIEPPWMDQRIDFIRKELKPFKRADR